jgi:hypothetical protein
MSALPPITDVGRRNGTWLPIHAKMQHSVFTKVARLALREDAVGAGPNLDIAELAIGIDGARIGDVKGGQEEAWPTRRSSP